MARKKREQVFTTKVTEEGRVCTVCNRYKRWGLFPKRKNKTCGYASECKSCFNKRRKATLHIDWFKWKAGILRSNLLYRISQELRETTPTTAEIKQWLESTPWVCYYTGEILTKETISIDHKIPIVRGGNNSLSNLCLCTKVMNGAKGTMLDSEFSQLVAITNTWEDKGHRLFKRLRSSYH